MANASNFMRGFTPASNPKRGNNIYRQRNWLLCMLKGPRLKTASYRTLGCLEYGMTNASNLMRGFTPASNPKRGNNIYRQRNWLLFMLKGPRLKTASYRTLGSLEYGMTNASNFMRGFTPPATPKGVTTYIDNALAFIYVKRAKAKIQCHIVP